MCTNTKSFYRRRRLYQSDTLYFGGVKEENIENSFEHRDISKVNTCVYVFLNFIFSQLVVYFIFNTVHKKKILHVSTWDCYFRNADFNNCLHRKMSVCLLVILNCFFKT